MNKVSPIVIAVLVFLLLSCTPEAAPAASPDAEQPTASAATGEDASTENSSAQQQAAAPTAEPTDTAAPQPAEPAPPVVVDTSPKRSEEQPLDAPVEVVFAQPMDRDSVEQAFSLNREAGTEVAGEFEWIDDRTVQFSPEEGFERGESYQVQIAEIAETQEGLSLQRPFELRFDAVGFLEVANVQPAAGVTDVAVDTTVMVFFNRPVVPLNAIDASQSLPDPVSFTPAVDGEGEWLNTAAYQFTPADGFDPATEYTARVEQGLTDVFGQAVLADDFEWTFTTVKPAVVASIPAAGDMFVSPTPVISIAFNQLMDHQSVEQNLRVVNEASGQAVSGEFRWLERGIIPPPNQSGLEEVYYPPDEQIVEPEPVGVETVSFTPADPLQLNTAYQLLLPEGVESELGVATAQAFSATFTTTPQPEVVSTNPADGEQFADIWQGLDITFNAPIDPESIKVGETLTVEPDIASTDIYTFTSNSDTMLTVNFPRQENRSYTVILTTDIQGRYGQALASPAVINWKTLRQSPYVRLVSPKIAVYNGYNDETYIYMTVRNVNRVRFNLYQLPTADFLELAPASFRGWDSGMEWEEYSPSADDLLGQWQQTTDPETFVNYVYKVDISQAVANGDALPPGLYYLEATSEPEDFYDEAQADDSGPVVDRQILIVSRNNLTIKHGRGDVLTWLTDLQSGQPVAGAPITFNNLTGETQTGTTDEDGVSLFKFEVESDQPLNDLFAFAGDPDEPGENFAVVGSEWSAGINPYEFSYLFGAGSYRYNSPYAGHVYTERPLYRSGQTVYFKGIIRADDDADYSIPTAAETAHVVIHDPRYAIIFEDDFSLNGFGTFNGEFQLDDEASLGNYQIEVSYDNPEDYTRTVAYHSFSVAEYRKPEFLVEAATDKDEYVQGDTIELSVDAEFFFGGPVQDAEVRWTLLSDDYYFEYTGEGYYDFTDEPDSRSNRFNPNLSFGFGEQIASGAGVTDADGRFTVEVPADLTGQLTSQRYTFDVAVIGLNNQEVATRADAIVHKGEFYVGLRPEQYVAQIGEPVDVEVLVVDWQSEPVANQEVELVFAEENWYSVQQLDPEGSRTGPEDQFYWRNMVENVALAAETVTTDREGRAVASFTPESGGNYKVYARAIDDQDHEIFSSVFVWVTGRQFVNWGQEDNDRIELIADQTQYSTGETANILIPHPYSDTATALITLERGHIYDHFVTELESNSAQIEIPVTDAMSPNIYVSAMIVSPSTLSSSQGSGSEAGQPPSFKMGYTRLSIDPEEKELQIALTPQKSNEDLDYYTPGEDVLFDIQVTDFQGQPVEAELSVALIDKAVLALAPDTPGRLMDAFWERRALQVQTANSLTLALDRINRALDERKGGGGGDGMIGPDSVRQNFADTALWIPDLVTDESGEATVETSLPDNLTTWVLIAKAVAADETLVGEARTEIVTSKPLLVRPVTPRFLVVDDQVQMGLIVQNNTDEALTANPTFSAEGLEIGDWRIANDDWQDANDAAEITVGAGEEVKLEYQVDVMEAEVARLTMGATSEEYNDGVAFELPIYNLITPETVATVGVLAEEGARVEGIALPAGADPSQGDLTVQIEPSLAAGIRSGLTYLENYPYDSTEQTASRLLANIYSYRAYQAREADNAQLADALQREVGLALQRLISQQRFDGGWGWWSQSDSDPFMTAYVLLGLLEAQQSDFTVEEWITQNAVEYLKQALAAPKDIAEGWQANRQAFILYVLAKAGQGDMSRNVTLYEQRAMLDTFGRAFLAMAMHQTDEEADQIDTLISEIIDEAIVSATGAHWEERQVDLYSMNTDVRSTAIVITALSRLQPDHPLLPQAVRWLMTAREQGGHWSSTQETAWAVVGLTEWLIASGELEADYAWQVSLNGDNLGEGEVDPDNLDQVTTLRVAVGDLLAGQVNRLVVAREATGGNEDEGNLYYGAYLTYFEPVEEVDALDRGISVSRQYSLQGSDEPITEADVGGFITVKLTLVAPNDLHYVVVEDYLPAGAEALDSSLATTSVVGQPPQLERVGVQSQPTPWGWWYFNHTDLRDEKAVLFADYLPQGVYEYTYTIRAAIPGEYQVIPTHARQMYFPEVFGRGEGDLLKIVE